MIEESKVKLGLTDLSVGDKLQFIAKLITRITGNPHFPDPAALLDTLIVAKDAMQLALTDRDATQAAAKSGTEVLTQGETLVDKALKTLAKQVELVADGDAAILESAGFDTWIPGKAGPVGPMPEVKSLTLTAGAHQGELLASWNPIAEASNYVVEYTLAPIFEPNWVQVDMPTASHTTISGLESGSKYWVRVAANASSGLGPWSDPATKIAP